MAVPEAGDLTPAVIGRCYQASAAAPEDTALLWIDTANGNLVRYFDGEAWAATSAEAGEG